MFEALPIFWGLCLVLSGSPTDAQLDFFARIPEEINAFLGSLFNSSIANAVKIANQFKFCNAPVDELRFILFNGSEPLEIQTEHTLDLRIPTKILIHGWYGTGKSDIIEKFAEQYRKKGKYNVIGVDWSRHSRKDYISSSCATRDVGKGIAEVILNLTKDKQDFLSNIHLIGHSLGAQIAGFVGKELKQRTGKKIGRITGLDAAAPLFEFPLKLPKSLRLDVEDAKYVDGVHTNMGFFGFAGAFGTADFFVDNGSPVQPGCSERNFFEDLVCSHSRAVDLYLESITSEKLVGLECPNLLLYKIGLCTLNKKAIMGEGARTTINGTYFVETRDKPPYGKG